MPISYSKQELKKLLSASANEALLFEKFFGVCFDTRTMQGGELFICLKDKIHGHQFIAAAFEKGAKLALVEDKSLLESHPEKDRLIFVENTLEAFSKLAKHYRKSLEFPIIAISGSMGKTTIKELTAQLLSLKSKGAFSKRSFNNHIGVPYTICSIDRDDSWAVLEMGMNHAGELSELSKLAEPDIALLSCIAPVHLENFSSLAAVADAKFEIVDGLSTKGKLILNADDPELMKCLELMKLSKSGIAKNVVLYGKDVKSDLLIGDLEDRGLDGIRFSCLYKGENYRFETSIVGRHNAYNICAAIMIALSVSPDFEKKLLEDAVRSLKPADMRLNIIPLRNGKILIDDSYNSSPQALRASLELLAVHIAQGKKVAAILGDMLELGESSEKYHREIAAVIKKVGIDTLITLGEQAVFFAGNGAAKKHLVAKNAEEAASLLFTEEFDIVLVKASRGVGLDKAVRLIKEERA